MLYMGTIRKIQTILDTFSASFLITAGHDVDSDIDKKKMLDQNKGDKFLLQEQLPPHAF